MGRLNLWAIVGFFVLILASGFMMVPGDLKSWNPMPFYQVVFVAHLSFLYVLVIPFLYAVEFYLIAKHKKFIDIVTGLTLFILALNVQYLINGWDLGLRYHGETHTNRVALINVFGFSLVLCLCIFGLIKKTRTAGYIANLMLFGLLSWCAFPYFGELP